MDSFINVHTMFLGLGIFQSCCCLCIVRELSDLIKNTDVMKMNKGLTGLELHEGE